MCTSYSFGYQPSEHRTHLLAIADIVKGGRVAAENPKRRVALINEKAPLRRHREAPTTAQVAAQSHVGQRRVVPADDALRTCGTVVAKRLDLGAATHTEGEARVSPAHSTEEGRAGSDPLHGAAVGAEMGAMDVPRLYLVCGLPGAGKSTRAKQIAGRGNALHLCVDDWVLGLGMSLVDYEFRMKLQASMLTHAGELLRHGQSVIVEFGSWSFEERAAIRLVAVREGATTELHFLDAPVDELVERVRRRGGPDAELLVSKVLLEDSGRFEHPDPEEIASFDRYFGPHDTWQPG